MKKTTKTIPFSTFACIVKDADVIKIRGDIVEKIVRHDSYISMFIDGEEYIFDENSGYELTVQMGATFVTTKRGNILMFYKVAAMNITEDMFF